MRWLIISLIAMLSACDSGGNDAVPDTGTTVVPGRCMAALDDNPWLQRRPLNIAHRGGAFEFPENTLFGYRESFAVGADVQEMDIFEAADGELIAIHDETVDRTTEGSGRISDLTTAEIKALDAAYWFVPGRGAVRDAEESEYIYRGIATGDRPPPAGYTANDFRIPTLREVLERFPERMLNIELKPDIEGAGNYEATLAALLAEFERGEEVIVASFLDPPSLLFKAQAPCIATSVPTAQVASFMLTSLGPLPGLELIGHQAFQVPVALGGVPVLSPDFVNDAHANGLAVHAWTINDCAEMAELLDMGVDGIMTDVPSVLDELLRSGSCPD